MKITSVRAEVFAHNPAFPSSYYCSMKCLAEYSERAVQKAFAEWKVMSDAYASIRGYK
jgi:hypothetical protein